MSGGVWQPVAVARATVYDELAAPRLHRNEPMTWPVAVAVNRYRSPTLATVKSARSPYESPARMKPTMLWYAGRPSEPNTS